MISCTAEHKKGAKNLMENLVKKAKSGDSGAFAQLIRMNTQSMYKVAWAYLKNDEDVQMPYRKRF